MATFTLSSALPIESGQIAYPNEQTYTTPSRPFASSATAATPHDHVQGEQATRLSERTPVEVAPSVVYPQQHEYTPSQPVGTVSPLRSSGWAAVEKTLADHDKLEVEGYKEDIDSLLTFAGLYSGVLTAFVIVSFPQLQEDSAAETLAVLRVIANQTSTLTGQSTSSTPVMPVPSTDSEPPIAAIRVNILWFASLVVSLSTASLAILVKQWLREYRAVASSSPQGQLRIRHFRRSGLDTWRVLGIASLLPLLLQISLALFFVGLCFFTASIHPAIKNTTVPLVCGWGFFITTVTLAPIFSSRCPYKTPALGSITKFLRTRVYAPIVLPVFPLIAFYLIHSALSIFLWVPINILLLLASWRWPSIRRSPAVKSWLRPLVQFDQFLHTRIKRHTFALREERETLKDESQDLVILASADDIQANPELDSNTMESALTYINPHWSEVIQLLTVIIGNRIPLPTDFSDGPRGIMVDLKTLSPDTAKAIKRLFLTHVNSKLPTNSDELSSSLKDHQVAGAWVISVLFWMYGHHAWDDFPFESFQLTCHWLEGQCRWDQGHAKHPQLLFWTCSLLSQSIYLPQSAQMTEVLEYAVDASKGVSADLLCCDQPAKVLGRLAKSAALRLLDTVFLPLGQRTSSSSSQTHVDECCRVMVVVMKLCGIVHSIGSSMDCGELLSERLRTVMRNTPETAQLKEIVAAWVSLPSRYIRSYASDLTPKACLNDDEYSVLAHAIIAVAKDASKQKYRLHQLLNLSLIALRLRVRYIRTRKRVSPAPSDNTPNQSAPAVQQSPGASSNASPYSAPDALWRAVFLHIATALRGSRRTITGEWFASTIEKVRVFDWVQARDEVQMVAEHCWALYKSSPGISSSGRQLVAPRYFWLELSLVGVVDWEKIRTISSQQFDEIRAMSRVERESIRREAEQEILGTASLMGTSSLA